MNTRKAKANVVPITIATLIGVGLFLAMFGLAFFREFVAALVSHWVGLMSGLISIIFTFYEKVRVVGKYALYVVATMCVFFSGFQAWQDEHRNLLAEQMKHNPQLEFAFIWVSTASETPNVDSDAVVFVGGDITNAGEMPSIVRKWSMDVQLPSGKHKYGQPLGFGIANIQLTNNKVPPSFSSKIDLERDYLPDLTAREPIKQGAGIPGVLAFKMFDFKYSEIEPGITLFTLCHEDVIHKSVCESITADGTSLGNPAFVPGMHYK